MTCRHRTLAHYDCPECSLAERRGWMFIGALFGFAAVIIAWGWQT